VLTLVVVATIAEPSFRGTGVPAARSFLERPIPPSPALAPNSAALVRRSLVPFVRNANLANSDAWGIPIVTVEEGDRRRRIDLFRWGYGTRDRVTFRIPAWARPTTGSDHHLAVVDGDAELNVWVAERQSDGHWRSGARTVVSGTPIAGPVAATASGFALTAGVVRPEEIARGRIDHALAFTAPYVRNRFVAPAVHGDGRVGDPRALPMGAHIQLDPRVDVSGLPRPQQIVARALQEYGAYLVDTGGSLALRAEASIGRARRGRPTDIWAPVGVTSSSLQAIPWHRMRVLAHGSRLVVQARRRDAGGRRSDIRPAGAAQTRSLPSRPSASG